MATKITRKTAIQFAGSATAGQNGVAQFGSLAASAKVYSTDPAVIQGLSQWLGGWNTALVGGASPALEDVNAVDYVASYQLGYLLQQGIAEWDSATNYFINSFCSFNGLIYISLTNSNLNNTPSALSTNWQIANGGSVKGENLFINGSMLVAQAGTSGTITASTPAYTLDGFIVDSVGANCAWSQTLVNNQNVLKLVPAGTLTDLYVKQRIESVQMQSIGYTNITIQAQITNNTGSTITPTLALNVATSADSTYTTVALAATNLQPIANGATAIVAYTFGVTSAHAYQNGMEVVFDFGSSVGSGTNIEMTNVDCSATPYAAVGLNSNPPTFKARQIETEILNCQRYFQIYDLSGTLPFYYFILGCTGDQAGTYYAIFPSFFFKVPFRSTPALTTSGTYSVQSLSDYSNLDNVSSFSTFAGTNNSASITCTLASGNTNAQPVSLVGAGATNKLSLSARL